MPRIKCQYCGGEHPDASAVKTCWRVSVGGVDEPEPASGPILGRSALITSEQPVPGPWRGLPVIELGPAAPEQLIEELENHHRNRSPVVIRLRGELADPSHAVVEGPVWALDPAFDFPAERAVHAATANSVDFRHGPGRWPWAQRAVALGAAPGGDVVLPDGRPALCDGGPLEFLGPADPGVDGRAVIHRIALEAGVLTPLQENGTLAELAPDQLAAVTATRAAARIIAPAGSGKTRVLTERARHLLRAWRIPPSAVCLVAYNRRAAGEMKQRTADLPELQIRTLNSLGLSILSGTGAFGGGNRPVRTLDEREVREILDRLVSFRRRANTDPAAAWIEALSAVRLGLHSPAEVEEQFNGELENLGGVFDDYRGELARLEAVDYDEQIYAALELLLSDPAVRKRARQRCRVVLVDEFQDLTPAHLLLIRTLAGPDGYVFGVGDDDQTIYGYADASPDWLIDFKRFFPSAGEHALEVNYRCPPGVVRAAGTLLTHNRRRVIKTIRHRSAPGNGRPGEAEATSPGEGAQPQAPGEGAQPQAPGEQSAAPPPSLAVKVTDDVVATTVEGVRAHLSSGAGPADIAVLTRVNSSLAPVQIALKEAEIPVNRAVDTNFANRTAVAAGLAWLRVALSPHRLRPEDVNITLRRPPRKLSPRAVEWAAEKRSLRDLRTLASRLDERLGPKLSDYADDIEMLSEEAATSDTAGLLTIVRDRIGLGGIAAVLDRARGRLERSPHEDELNVLIQIGRLHPGPHDFEKWLRSRLAEPGDPTGVTLATVHKVKGQEWDRVIVHDATAGIMPHRLASDGEEERRIFHVGITRCRTSVTVVAGSPPTPFLDEMAREWVAAPEPEPAAPGQVIREGTRPVVGMVVTDGGYEATVESIEAGGVVVRIGASTNLIPYGKRVYAAGSPTVFIPPSQEAPSKSSAAAEAALRQWRLERARAEGKPAFVFLQDATLKMIAEKMPGNLEELALIKGIGPAKLEALGDQILGVIEEAL